jgi:hypothetical protein
MAKKHDILYVNFYTGGSAAHKIELTPPQPRYPEPAVEPQAKPKQRTVVYVDPLAMVSIAVSVVMLVLMVVGMMTLTEAHTKENQIAGSLQLLQAENVRLQAEFDDLYDPAVIKDTALALGMVPVEQVEHRTIQVMPVEEIPEEPTFWEQVQDFFAGLFA